MKDFNKRFWSKVDKTENCWFWKSDISNKGYGRFRIGNRKPGAHRVAYELVIGPIPDGLTLDHLCKVKNCVNPYHLEPVTWQENVLRSNNSAARNAKKTHCPQGHEYSGINSQGSRICKICIKAQGRLRYVQAKAF